MPITIIIPTALKQFAGEHTSLTLEAESVGAALDHLTRQFPELRPHLYREDNRLRSFVNIYLNDEDIRHTNGSDTVTNTGDTIMIVPAIAGGKGQEQRAKSKELRAKTTKRDSEKLRLTLCS